MAYEIGTATGLEDMFTKILRFLQGYGTAGTPGYTGTGNGTITNVDTFPATITETWTITCTATAPDGGTFSVVGSVSGAQANATVGTPYANAFISFLINDGAVDFAINDQFTIATTVGVLPTLQRWEVLRLRRDNLDQFLTNLTEPPSGSQNNRRTNQTYRYDARSLNTDDLTTQESFFSVNNAISGTSYVRWELTDPAEIATLRIRAPLGSGFITYAPQDFILQYSDDGIGWTTALTVASAPGWSLGERRDWAVSPAPGVHKWWQVIWNKSGTLGWSELLLLKSGGTVANHFGSEVILKAKGNAGTDAIYCGIRSEYDQANGWFNLFLNGYSGYDPNEQSWLLQPGAIDDVQEANPMTIPSVPLWDTTMPYWFVASGRSFRFAVKVSTSYEGGYLGFILPYSTPSQYPYPLAIGGSLVPQDGANTRDEEWRYSYADENHGVYPGPGGTITPTGEYFDAALYLKDEQGQWRSFANRPNSGTVQPDGIYGPQQSTSIPFVPSGASRSVWPHCMNDQWAQGKKPYREVLGGGYIIQPCIMLQRLPTPNVFGELEGTFAISGFNNSPENTATYGGVTHVVFQNAYRNTPHEFWALSLDT